MSRRVRLIAAHVALALIAGSMLRAYLVTGFEHVKTVYIWAPTSVVPRSFVRQVRNVQDTLPRRAALVYVEQKFDAWQFGLWKRTLYPENMLVHATSQRDLLLLKREDAFRYVLIAGPPPTWVGFQPLASFPGSPGGQPVILGALQ